MSESATSPDMNAPSSGAPQRNAGRSGGLHIVIKRPTYTQEQFDEGHDRLVRPRKNLRDRCKKLVSHCSCSCVCFKHWLASCLPFISIMRTYNVRTDLVGDLIAGLTVGIMHIPQGMAYGLLTTLPAVYGLYVSFFPVIFYFFLGTSRHISIGTFAVVSLMVGSAVERADCSYSNHNPSNSSQIDNLVSTLVPSTSTLAPSASTGAPSGNMSLYNSTDVPSDAATQEVLCRVGVATAVSFLAGLIQLAMGILRLGFVTIYLSEPLTRGLTTGAAIHVFTSQIKHVFGISVQSYQGPLKLVYTYIDFFSKIAETNIAALITSVLCIVAMSLVKELANPKVKKVIKMPIPVELIVVVVGTLISYFCHMEDQFNVDVVGEIPTGIPPPSMPPVSRFSLVIVDAVSIALVSFAINVSLVKLFAKKHNYQTNPNQELVAYGVSNTLSSMFNCFMSSASLSRSLVQEGVGGVTQVAGLISSGLLLVVLFAIGPLFEQLPKCILAAIILVNLKGMFLQFRDLKELWVISIYDFLTWLVVFTAVVFLDVDLGLGIGIGFCLLTVVFRTQSPYTCLLGRVPHTDIYKDITVYHAATEVPGVKIFRLDASLYFANAEHFVKKLFTKSQVNPRQLKTELDKQQRRSENSGVNNDNNGNSCLRHRKAAAVEEGEVVQLVAPPISDIIIDCTTMAYIDYVGVATLSQVMAEYKAVDISVSLAGCKAGIREMLEAAGFYEKIPRDQLFVSVHDAVLVALENNPTLLEQILQI